VIVSPIRKTAPDSLTNQNDVYKSQGRRTRRVGRTLYLLFVLGFAIYLLSALTGHLLVLNASGLVTSDRFVIGAAYTARVVETRVAPGDKVRAGQVIARLESTEVLTSLAQLAQNMGLVEERRQSILNRRDVIAALMPVAERRLTTAKQGEMKLERDPDGLVTPQRYRSEVRQEAFEAERDLLTLRTEARSITSELVVVDVNIAEIRSAVDKMRQAYADGVVVATVDGTVSTTVASPGQVLNAGEPVLELLSGPTYVLAYLSNGRLYDVMPGENVVLTNGVRTIDARVERVDAVADNLPAEFRTTFGLQERQQIMRVSSQDEIPFPYLSRIRVISPWSLTYFLSQVKGTFADLIWPKRAHGQS
jgi:multidrug resistance efflux pump